MLDTSKRENSKPRLSHTAEDHGAGQASELSLSSFLLQVRELGVEQAITLLASSMVKPKINYTLACNISAVDRYDIVLEVM